MLKSIITLLFTFILAHNLFAENISDVKLQIQEKQIEKLEKKIDDIDSKFNQNNIDKKEINGKLEKNEAVVNNLNLFLTIYGILITILLLVISYVSYKFTSNEAKEMVNDWIKNNKNEILEPVIKEGNKLLKNIRKEADILIQDYQVGMKNYDLKKELDSKEKDILEKVNILLESKETENYTFDDWHSKFLDYFYKKDFNIALEMLDKALEKTKNDNEIVRALFNKALALGMLKKNQDAIKIYDDLIERFKDSKHDRIIARALCNKGISFSELREYDKVINVSDELVNRFKDSVDIIIMGEVSKSLYNKATALEKLKKDEEAIIIFDELLERFKDSKENQIAENVANALYAKGLILGKLKKDEEAITIFDEFLERFKDSKENQIVENVANVLFYKVHFLKTLAKNQEVIINAYDEFIRRFKDTENAVILKNIGSALVNKIELNIILNKNNLEDDFLLLAKLAKENIELMMKYKILEILENSKIQNRDIEIAQWREEFKDFRLNHWTFDELKDWADRLESGIKERILGYISIFENHNANINLEL